MASILSRPQCVKEWQDGFQLIRALPMADSPLSASRHVTNIRVLLQPRASLAKIRNPGAQLKHGLTLISEWISNYLPNEVCD